MIKYTTRDIVAILRLFGLATDQTGQRDISYVQSRAPADHSTIVAFVYQKNHYYIIHDDEIEDNESTASLSVAAAYGEQSGSLVRNPKETDFTAYGMPYKGKEVYLYKAAPTTMRLDILVSQRHPELSRSNWQKHIKAGHVQVNGSVVHAPRTEVHPHDTIVITMPESAQEKVALPVLYSDNQIMAVSKPAGMLTHAKGGIVPEYTVKDFFETHYLSDDRSDRTGIVHRLDRATSGVIVGGRTKEAVAELQRQFASRRVQKVYVAVVQGTLPQPEAIIDVPIARNPKKPSTFRADSRGKSAQTRYRVISIRNGYSTVLLFPKTGRTHQLRVHLAYLGTPIVGDPVYGTGNHSDRLMLHALQLTFTNMQGEEVTVQSPLSDEFLPYVQDISAITALN